MTTVDWIKFGLTIVTMIVVPSVTIVVTLRAKITAILASIVKLEVAIEKIDEKVDRLEKTMISDYVKKEEHNKLEEKFNACQLGHAKA